MDENFYLFSTFRKESAHLVEEWGRYSNFSIFSDFSDTMFSIFETKITKVCSLCGSLLAREMLCLLSQDRKREPISLEFLCTVYTLKKDSFSGKPVQKDFLVNDCFLEYILHYLYRIHEICPVIIYKPRRNPFTINNIIVSWKEKQCFLSKVNNAFVCHCFKVNMIKTILQLRI
jgi:hypothetical protein